MAAYARLGAARGGGPGCAPRERPHGSRRRSPTGSRPTPRRTGPTRSRRPSPTPRTTTSASGCAPRRAARAAARDPRRRRGRRRLRHPRRPGGARRPARRCRAGALRLPGRPRGARARRPRADLRLVGVRPPPGENDSGTDHGAGGLAWVQGTARAAGVLTDYPDLEHARRPRQPRRDRRLPPRLLALLEEWLGTDAGAVIPNAGAFGRVALVQ